MQNLRSIQYIVLAAALWGCGAVEASDIRQMRLPAGGVQPQAVADADGNVHVIFLRGEPGKADVFYMTSGDGGESFGKPIRVNNQAGSAVTAGTIRGAQIAIGREGRVHVAWNGSSIAEPKGPRNPEQKADSPYNGLPLLYSRLGDDGTFEAQRNLMTKTFGLDGGGSIAADAEGLVYVAWHGSAEGAPKGEAGRRVWLARSRNDGDTFAAEKVVFDEPTGACACCGMRLFVDSKANLLALYRSAKETVHRDIYLLVSSDRGETFRGKMLDPWEIGGCPMSSMSFAESADGVLAAWETAEQVYFAQVDADRVTASAPVAAPGPADNRKHPRLARNKDGGTLLAWTTAKGWGKPGALHWQSYAADGTPEAEHGGVPTIPAWSFAAVFARPDGGFTVLY